MDGHVGEVGALGDVTAQRNAMTPQPTDTPAELTGQQYLLFWLGAWPCLVRLAELREALPAVPRHVALPFSPRWLWGIFPLRTDIVALIDPLPMLTLGPEAARHASDTSLAPLASTAGFGLAEPPRALVVGEDEHQLALLVDRIGDIYVIRDDDRRPLSLPAEPGAAPLPQYVAEAYAVPGLDGEALALRVSKLVEDALSALEERQDHV